MDVLHTECWIFIFIYFLKLITYMETLYGGLWYAAGNPDGFRFGTVNRPSQSHAKYITNSSFRKEKQGGTSKLQNFRNFEIESNMRASKLVGQVIKETFYSVHCPPVGRRSPPDLLRRHWGPRFCHPGLPTCSLLLSGCACARSGVRCSARQCVRLIQNAGLSLRCIRSSILAREH